MIRISCCIGKFKPDENCDKVFSREIDLNSHMLFTHEILMPICSTGIDEKIWHDNMELIKQYKRVRYNRMTYKTTLKKRLLKSLYGKKFNMHDVNQDNVFKIALDNYNKNVFSRIKFIEHGKYDMYYKEEQRLQKILEVKGLVVQ